jgi:hypothetical protein
LDLRIADDPRNHLGRDLGLIIAEGSRKDHRLARDLA